METSSKRDIYDLIAELAKSADMDLEGTEFAPEKMDMRRKPGLPATEEKAKPEIENPIVDQGIATPLMTERTVAASIEAMPNEVSSQHGSSNLENDLIDLRQKTLEELSEIKKFIQQELKEKRNPVEENPNLRFQEKIAAVINNRDRSSRHSMPHDSLHTADLIQELKASNQSLVEEVQKLKSLYSFPNQVNTAYSGTTGDHQLHPLTIERLNRITNPASNNQSRSTRSMSEGQRFEEDETEKRRREISNDLIIDQLMLINEKIDEIQTNNLKGELAKEIKQSDDRILEQMKQNKDDVLLGLLSVKDQKNTIGNNSIMRILGVLNLLLLLMVMLYLFVSKMSAQSTSQVEQSFPTQPNDIERSNFDMQPSDFNSQAASRESLPSEKMNSLLP